MSDRTVKTSFLSFAVPAQAIDDVLCSAFEGGSNYWISSIEELETRPSTAESISDVLSRGKVLIINVVGDERYDLNVHMFIRGAMEYARATGRWVLTEECDHDATDADCVLQYALFGEVVYG